MSRIWNFPIPIASTASDNVKVSSSFSEIQTYWFCNEAVHWRHKYSLQLYTQLTQLWNETLKKFRLQWDVNLWPLLYWHNALTTDLSRITTWPAHSWLNKCKATLYSDVLYYGHIRTISMVLEAIFMATRNLLMANTFLKNQILNNLWRPKLILYTLHVGKGLHYPNLRDITVLKSVKSCFYFSIHKCL